MTLLEKAKAMRAAIDRADLALHGFGNLTDAIRLWADHDRKEVGIIVRANCGEVHQIGEALTELNRIIHSPDFEF